MVWLLLLILALAAVFGVLGLVVKAAAVVLLTLALVTIALVAAIWYAFRYQLRKLERSFGPQPGGGNAVPSDERPPPPLRDDRY